MGLKNFIANIGKANAEINSGNEAADAALTAAKITTLKVDGKDVPSAEAPLSVKISAIAALVASGDKTQDISELIASNGQIAAQVEDLTGRNATLTATVSGQAQKISSLETELATSKTSVATLTAEVAGHKNLLEAAGNENVRVTGLLNSANAEISKQCIAVNCLTLTDGEGKPLAKTATDSQKLESANKIPVAEKITALMGAIHSSAANIGLDLKQVPAVSGGGTAPDSGNKLSADAQIAKHLASKK
jgi:chromosome segregation ATPase